MKDSNRWSEMAAELEGVIAESRAALAKFDAAQDRLKGSIERTRRSTPPVPLQRPIAPPLVLPVDRKLDVLPGGAGKPPAKASAG